MREEPFDVPVVGGVLAGHRGGDGPPALLLHGGPGFSDYTDGCAEEFSGRFRTLRYTQRGTPPTTAGPPYTIESHMADALAVLDPLGAHDVFAEFGANLRRGLSAEGVARIDEVEVRRRAGETTEADLLERLAILWPRWFADPEDAPAHLAVRIGAECSADTNASIARHFELGTLVQGLPGVRLPALFVHGALDPLPLRASTDTAALIPGAVVEAIPDCGHFPWLERPGELRRAVERQLAAVART